VHPNLVPHDYSIGNDNFPNATKGTHFDMDQIALPVQLVWHVPNVVSTKHWNLLDQLMPLYSCVQKYTNYDSPTMGLMPELYVSLAIIPNEVTQSRRKRGVLIELLEPDDDSDGKRPRKRKLHAKYRLRFVNKVHEAYYTMDPIKADDGSHLKVALFDENNEKITFEGPDRRPEGGVEWEPQIRSENRRRKGPDTNTTPLLLKCANTTQHGQAASARNTIRVSQNSCGIKTREHTQSDSKTS